VSGPELVAPPLGATLPDLRPERARRKRLIRVPGKHEIDRIADRRPRFYAALVEPNGRD